VGKPCALAAAMLMAAFAGQAQTRAPVAPAVVETYIEAMFHDAPEAWQSRVVQDETQRLCSDYRNVPPPDVANAIRARAAASIVYPADGVVVGDWKRGEAIAEDGRGGQFSDPPGMANGGNCYACHRMAPGEESYGTLGPTLTEYGRIRNFSAEEARAAYGKIFNSQSVQPCSTMPRFGHHHFLSEQQIKDLTAYLMSPASPVNKSASDK
jgi:sulfur-oxidizing protein SoxX